MKQKKYVYLGAGIIAIALIIFFSGKKTSEKSQLLNAQVQKGEFDILVTTTGELQAKNSEKIMAPQELRSRSLRFREIKITNLVPEGTLVDSGDFVAELDRGEAANMLKDIDDECQKIQSQYTKTQLDTTMKMRDLRDQLINQEFELEEKQLVVDQSMYEPPATQRKAKIDLEKANRTYIQALKNYTLKEKQSKADMKEVAINQKRQARKKEELLSVLKRFNIHADKPGMVIYTNEWGGQKRKVGSMINPWDLVVATLPDLSVMISKTYVNEIDISKIKKGQTVQIGVDAFPDQSYTGVVTKVANIGEKLSNSDAKVFEVIIEVNESNSILRPAMTTSNSILIKHLEDVLYLPLEAVHSNDSLSYVYTKSKQKQIVLLGESNENQVVIKKGLNKNDKVYLSIPEKSNRWKYAGLELYSNNENNNKIAQHKKQ